MMLAPIYPTGTCVILRVLRAAACLVFGLIAAASASHADEQAAWTALRQGGHVALMRHADAPGPAGDPPGFKLEDCATQRNLSAEGRAEAMRFGTKLKGERVAIERVLSSPWCRCTETATLMEIGVVEIEATFSNAFSLADQRAALAEGARRIIAGWKGPGALLVSTHGANILALTGISPASGEIVVVAPNGVAPPRVIGRIPVPRPG